MMNVPEQKKTIASIVIFSLLVTAIAFAGPLLGGSPSRPGLGFVLWGTAPLLVACALRIATNDWSDAGLRLNFSKNRRWYALVVLACPVLMGLTLLAGRALSAFSITGFAPAPYFSMVLPGLAVFFLFAIFEEFGWRGYLVPKLASAGANAYLASAVVALVWGTWHMPYIRDLTWVYSGTEGLLTAIPRLYLMFFAYALLYNEIRLITGSVWPAVLLHAVTNAVQHPLAADYLQIAPGMEPLASFNGFLMIVFVALLGVGLNRWRMGRMAPVLSDGSVNAHRS